MLSERQSDATHESHEAEQIERAALDSLHALLDARLTETLKAQLAEVGDGVASVLGALPASSITVNRVLGLGLTRPIARADIARVKALYAAAGVARFLVQLHPDAARAGAADACAAAGLKQARGWQKFARGTEAPVPENTSDFEVREIGPAHGDAFARIVCAAHDIGEAAEPWLARLPGSGGDAGGGWRVFLTFEGETPVGTGALYLRDGAAWTDFGATAPAFRGRGAQRANLAHRVRTALAAGCTRLYTCTGEAVPGDPQHSYANIKRCGFQETYLRENWQP